MWHALSSNYEYLKRYEDAIKCQKRFMELSNEGIDPKMHIKLSKLYKNLNQLESSSLELRKVYEIIENSNGELKVQDYVQVYKDLAFWELNMGNLSLCQHYLSRIIETNSPEREDARTLLRNIQMKELENL